MQVNRLYKGGESLLDMKILRLNRKHVQEGSLVKKHGGQPNETAKKVKGSAQNGENRNPSGEKKQNYSTVKLSDPMITRQKSVSGITGSEMTSL